MKISVEGVWLDPPQVDVPCQANAGLCPNAEFTFGEPHYCSKTAEHVGLHRCRRCGMEYNADSVVAWKISEDENNIRVKMQQSKGSK